ncbi:MAG TPA: M14 family metallopeptidase [Gaiellaceae bacterium]
MPRPDFDRFYRYEELTGVLEAWVQEHPGLIALESIGKSHEGREIWLATITNTDTGPALEKPAFLIEANIHSIEVTAATAALHLIDKLLAGYGEDERITRVLDTRAFYVIPRLNPDGAELALAERPKFIRSSTRPWPLAEELDGLYEEDLDGDGRILMMRMRDPNGSWKPHAEEPRLMVRRDPDEEGGEYYRMLWEGRIRNYDGVTIKIAPPLEGLDLNRNFPMEWAVEAEQRGAGPYPTSEPEIRAMVQAIVERPNITGHIAYHTFSGVHLRPYSSYPDEQFPTQDLRTYKLLGDKATELTGYPAVSIFHDFKYDPKQTVKGGANDWLYDHLGVYTWTTEFWSPQREAGIEDYGYIEWIRDHPPEDDLKLLRWSDEQLDGKGYVDWYPFEHDQLGEVELGGWDLMHAWANVPTQFLEREIAPHSELAIWHLAISPRLELLSADVEKLGESSWLVRLVLHNTGWLPTSVSQKAVERKAVRPLEAEITLPEDARLHGGEKKVELGQLDGRVHRRSLLWWASDDATSDRAKVEWIVEAPAGSVVQVEARHQRAGTVRRELTLE